MAGRVYANPLYIIFIIAAVKYDIITKFVNGHSDQSHMKDRYVSPGTLV